MPICLSESLSKLLLSYDPLFHAYTGLWAANIHGELHNSKASTLATYIPAECPVHIYENTGGQR